jgi:hypothetical protein
LGQLPEFRGVCRGASEILCAVAMQVTASFKITVCGIAELTEHCEARICHAVSIFDRAWLVPSALDTYLQHECLELRFDDVIEPVPGKHLRAHSASDNFWLSVRRLTAEPAATRHLLICGGPGFLARPQRWP